MYTKSLFSRHLWHLTSIKCPELLLYVHSRTPYPAYRQLLGSLAMTTNSQVKFEQHDDVATHCP
jgi:hypothetical protein